MWIVFFRKGADELDVRKDNTRHFSTPPVLPEGLEIAAVTAAGGGLEAFKVFGGTYSSNQAASFRMRIFLCSVSLAQCSRRLV